MGRPWQIFNVVLRELAPEGVPVCDDARLVFWLFVCPKVSAGISAAAQ